ncbi:prepilin peptidase [Floccifex sp.]|uniref:prepilin peptidase n=1 Tax=Floccifex sp. TaxID=2815810 RepID=UPI003F0F84E8
MKLLLLFLAIHYLKYQSFHSIFIDFMILNILSFFNIPFLISIFLYCLCLQDYYTYHISKIWIPFSILFLIHFHKLYFLNAILFSFPCFLMYLKKGMGSADVCFIFLFALCLGYQRMMVAFFISIFCGFIFYAFKQKLIPFCSCLAIGVFIALWKGYTIFYFFM